VNGSIPVTAEQSRPPISSRKFDTCQALLTFGGLGGFGTGPDTLFVRVNSGANRSVRNAVSLAFASIAGMVISVSSALLNSRSDVTVFSWLVARTDPLARPGPPGSISAAQG